MLLVVLSALGPLALNIFMPSMPAMVDIFATDYGTVQLTLSLYLSGMAVAQIFMGGLSDRYGRRPTVLGGLAVFFLGSIICTLAASMEVVIAGRIIQAIGAAAGLAMSRAIIRDVHGMDKAASMIAYLTMAMVIAPIFAPTLGGLLHVAMGWQGGFILVAVLSVLLFFLARAGLHETHLGPYRPLNVGVLFHGFSALLRQAVFLRYALVISFSAGAFFSFLGGAPYVAMELLGSSSTIYGYFFIIAGVAYMIGNFVTARLSQRVGIDALIFVGTSIGLVGGAELIFAYASGYFTMLTMFLGMAIIALGNGICMPTGTAGAVSADPSRIGAAAGLSGFMQMGLGATASWVVGLLLGSTPVPMIATMATCLALAFSIDLIAGRIITRQKAAIANPLPPAR